MNEVPSYSEVEGFTSVTDPLDKTMTKEAIHDWARIEKTGCNQSGILILRYGHIEGMSGIEQTHPHSLIF